ncbi:MAG: flagellar hook-associated protein FlgK [Planctomycetes bacterium]|nr:flagellar hook-associated protein FlgK [Planctomycetota bacterium]
MTTVSFNTALSALTTAQSALAIIGNNIANAATPGYSRQRVGLDSLPAMATTSRFQIGRGVTIDGVDRITDALLVGRLRNQQSEVGRYGVLSGHYRQLETLFGEPGPNGLNSLMSGFFADVSSLTSAPEDTARRVGLIESGRSIADGFNSIARQLTNVGRGLSEAIKTEVVVVNSIASELAQLNNSIAEAAMGPSIPSDLLDRQEALLRELGEHIDVRSVREADGRVTVFSASNVLVSPRGSYKLEAYDIDPLNGRMGVRSQGAGNDLTPRGGRLRALLELAEQGVDERMAGLDQLARSLILEVNRVHSTGVPLNGGYKTLHSTNVFYDANGSGSPLDDTIGQAELPFDVVSGSLNVNVTDLDTGTVTQSQIAIDPSMTVQELVDSLDSISGLSANVGPGGQLRITALGNKRFDFSNRVQPIGDLDDTFGSAAATISGAAQAT